MKYAAAFLLFFMSCADQHKIMVSENVFVKATAGDSLSFYFPAVLNDSVKRPNSIYTNFKQNWYSASLYSFKEPILYNKKDQDIIYRLLWLRSFHVPVCFTMKKFNGDYYLNAKALDREPAFFPLIEGKGIDPATGKEILDTIQKANRLAFISFDTTIVLKTYQWKKIEDYLLSLDFWNSPVADPADDNSTDGSNWIIEGRKDNQYHFIDRRNAKGNLLSFGKYLIRKSGIDIKEHAIY